jgi:hypothetical protein
MWTHHGDALPNLLELNTTLDCPFHFGVESWQAGREEEGLVMWASGWGRWVLAVGLAVFWGLVLPGLAHLGNPVSFPTSYIWISLAIFGTAYLLLFGFIVPWLYRRYRQAPPPG